MSTTRCAFALFVIGSLWGCGTNATIEVYTCEDPCGNGEVWECDEPCKPCPGECLPLAPLGFSGPALLWIGNKELAPECPARAPLNAYEGYADLDVTNACPTCECSEPACVFPDGLKTSGTSMCEGPELTSFDAPERWNGACIAPVDVPRDQLSSIQIPAPTVSACEPFVAPSVQPRSLVSPWRTFARACLGESISNVCGDPGKTCVPTAGPPPPEFVQCLLYERDRDPDAKCPGDYPDKHVFYDDAEDTRSCTPCACGAPEGSECAASISMYRDDDCMSWTGSELSTLEGPKCVGGPGMELGGVTAEWRKNKPGSCQASGGEPLGTVTPHGVSVFCCQGSSSDAAPR